MATVGPGSGNYNPMSPLPKLHLTKKKPDDWIKYHKDFPKNHTFRAENGNYTPTPVVYSTF